jgi:hypothetical protein
MKRCASNTEAGTHKKQRRENDIAPKVAAVRTTLTAIEALPEDVRNMLSTSLAIAASVEKPARHEFQVGILEMVARALFQEEQRLEAALQVAKDGFAVAEDAKAAAEKTRDDAKADFEAKVQSAADQAATLERAKQAQKEAAAALKGAQSEQENLAKEAKELQKTSSAEWLVYTENLKALRREPLEGETEPAKMDGRTLKKHVGKVVDALKSAKADSSLVDSIPAAFAKSPAERGEFDRLAWDSVEKIFTSRKADADATLARFEAGDATIAAGAKIEACTNAVEGAKSQVEREDLELAARTSARTEAEAGAKAAADEAKGSEKKAQSANSEKETAEEKLAGLQETLRTFEALRERGVATEQPEVDEASHVQEGAPVEAAPIVVESPMMKPDTIPLVATA